MISYTMQHFMSEEEAIALIEENMDKIDVKMASGQSSAESVATGSFNGGGNNPCGGPSDIGCHCCKCG